MSADSTSTTSATANSVRAIGGAPDLGPAGGLDLNVGLVDIAAHPDADGYWLVSADGGVFSFGAAQFYGSTGALPLQRTDRRHGRHAGSGAGYWLVGADGGVFSFGDAPFLGSLGGSRLQRADPRHRAARPAATATG